mmetsp:Transcript_11215/g.20461  ORF Transcript_11215/g.20461 Transcript_11215/m.20461 type:complete len:308 (+) Transcript_11215:65-988(+)
MSSLLPLGNQDALAADPRLQALWHLDAAHSLEEAQDRYFQKLIALIDKDTEALRCKLQAKRQAHQQERFSMLQEVAGRRLALMDQNIEERPHVDLEKLMDLTKFDRSARCRDIVDEATASARCRAEATRALMSSHFEEAKHTLEAQIATVQAEREQEKQAHEANMARLTTLLQAKIRSPHGRAGRRASTHVKDGQPSRRSSRMSPARGTPRPQLLVEDMGISIHSSHGAAAALSQDSQVRQWGALFVGQLGLTSYPSKPRRFTAASKASRRLVSPRVASSNEEAFPRLPDAGRMYCAEIASPVCPRS